MNRAMREEAVSAAKNDMAIDGKTDYNGALVIKTTDEVNNIASRNFVFVHDDGATKKLAVRVNNTVRLITTV